MLLRQGPIFMQLGSMLCSPLPDEPLAVGRKLALHQTAVKGKGRTTPFMTRMKMRFDNPLAFSADQAPRSFDTS